MPGGSSFSQPKSAYLEARLYRGRRSLRERVLTRMLGSERPLLQVKQFRLHSEAPPAQEACEGYAPDDGPFPTAWRLNEGRFATAVAYLFPIKGCAKNPGP